MVIADVDEQLLIRAAQTGDRPAWSRLYARHRDPVLRRVSHLVGATTTAEDVVQDAFLKAFRSLDTFRGECPFSFWLLGIATHVALQERRRAKRSIWRLFGGQEHAAERTIDGAAAAYPDRAAVQAALADLSPRLREAVISFELEGRSLGEIADALALPVPTVAARVRRGRLQLKRRLEHMGWRLAVVALFLLVSGAFAWVSCRKTPAAAPLSTDEGPVEVRVRRPSLRTVPAAVLAPRVRRPIVRKVEAVAPTGTGEFIEPDGDVIWVHPRVQQAPLFDAKEYKSRGVLVQPGE